MRVGIVVKIYPPSESCWREVAILWIGASSCKTDRLACTVKRPGGGLHNRTCWGSICRDREDGVIGNNRTKRIGHETTKARPVIGKDSCGKCIGCRRRVWDIRCVSLPLIANWLSAGCADTEGCALAFSDCLVGRLLSNNGRLVGSILDLVKNACTRA